MICGSCPYTDGHCYTAMPPKVKCTITDEFHLYDDECDCQEEKMLRAIKKIKVTVEPSDDDIKVLNGTCDNITIGYDQLSSSKTEASGTITVMPTCVYTACMVCGECIEIDLYTAGPVMCPECKRAIRFIKEKFKEELYSL